MVIKEVFTAKEVCKICKIKYRRLDYMINKGVILPSIKSANGKGTRRVFAFFDLVKIRVANQFIQSGVSVPVIVSSLMYLEREFNGTLDMGNAKLVSDGKKIYRFCDNETLVCLDESGQLGFGFVFDLEPHVTELRYSMKRYFDFVDKQRKTA